MFLENCCDLAKAVAQLQVWGIAVEVQMPNYVVAEWLKEQITAVFLEAFPYLTIVVHEIVGSPGDAGVRASITGTHLGDGD